jgi:hypothetical protein
MTPTTATAETTGTAIPTDFGDSHTLGLPFEHVLGALKSGRRVRRLSRPGHILFRQVPSTVPAEIVGRMTSLPPAVKAEFTSQALPAVLVYCDQIAVYVETSLCRFTVVGYSPSVEDLFATDWEVIDH